MQFSNYTFSTLPLSYLLFTTFEPDNATELLLIAVANIGCHYSRSRHSRLYRGLFMQVLRDSIQQQVSLFPALSRYLGILLTLDQLPHDPANSNLELVQCGLLYQMSLMCGGHLNEVLKLQFERSALATLFRYFRTPMNKNVQRNPTADTAAGIEELWRAWVDAETKRRNLYRVWGKYYAFFGPFVNIE